MLLSTGETYALGSSTYSPIGSWFTLVVVFDKVAGTLSAYRDGESLGQVTSTMGGGTGMPPSSHNSIAYAVYAKQ